VKASILALLALAAFPACAKKADAMVGPSASASAAASAAPSCGFLERETKENGGTVVDSADGKGGAEHVHARAVRMW
jgi:hypothetical protein